MTLGIGVLCEKGECMVVASEQRATYGDSPIGPNDECGKQYYIKPLRCMVSTAGSMSTCHAVFSQLAWMVQHLKDPDHLSRETFMDMIDAVRYRELRRRYDWQIKKKMGFSFKQWASGKLSGVKMHPLIIEYGLAILDNTPFKVEMIVAGYSGDIGMFFRAIRKEALEEETSPGVYAIGTGQVAAMRQFNKRGQNSHMSLARSLLHVYEAMHVAQSRVVGPPPEMVAVIRRRESRMLKFPLTSLEQWRNDYQARATTASIDDSTVARNEVYSRLKVFEKSDEGT